MNKGAAPLISGWAKYRLSGTAKPVFFNYFAVTNYEAL